MSEEQEQRLRELRAELALLGFVVTTHEFWAAAANAIRFQSEELRRRR